MIQPKSKPGVLLPTVLIALLAFTPTAVWAQGFEFGEDEVEEVPETPTEDGAMTFDAEEQDSGPMTFDSNDLSAEDAVETKTSFQTAIVALPDGMPSPELTREVQAKMMEQAGGISAVIPQGPEGVLPALSMRGGMDCVTDSLCLGMVGEEAGVERILLARVKSTSEGLQLDVDYFDVGDRLFVKYHSAKGLGSGAAVVDAIGPAYRDIFEIRERGPKQEYVGDEDASMVQDIVAWGSAGLAVAFLGGGIVYGMDASSQEEAIEAKRNGDIYTVTQAEAQSMVRDAEGAATTANVFFGLSVAMTVTSVVFFIIKGGSDVANGEERVDLIEDIHVGPTFYEAGAGIGAGFSF